MSISLLIKRERRVEADVMQHLSGSVIVSPSDSVSGAAALGAAKAKGTGWIGIGTIADDVSAMLAWRNAIGRHHYYLVVNDAAKMTEEAWDALRIAMPLRGLIIISAKLEDIPVDIQNASVTVDGLATI